MVMISVGYLSKDMRILYTYRGRGNEPCYKCTLRSAWAHSACSSHNWATNYICDYCC